MNNFKVDDWIYFEFELYKIKAIEDGRVTEVTDGYYSTSGYDLTNRCFSINAEIKILSEYFKVVERNLYEIRILNCPDVHRYLTAKWARACCDINEEKNQVAKVNIRGAAFMLLNKFKDSVIDRYFEVKNITVDNIKIFKE